MHNNQKGFGIVGVLLVVLVLVVIGGTGWFVFTKSNQAEEELNSNNTNTLDRSENTAGYAEYKNSEFGFSFIFPESWGRVEFSSAGAELGFNGGGGIKFSDKPLNNGGYEIGPFKAKTYQDELDVPVFLSAQETAENLAKRSLTTPDGGKYRYELIADNGDSHIFANCYYGVGVNISAKLGDDELHFSLNFGGNQSGSGVSHECAKTDTRKLSDIISQEDLDIANKMVESISQN